MRSARLLPQKLKSLIKKLIVKSGRLLLRYGFIKRSGKKMLAHFPRLRGRLKTMLGLQKPVAVPQDSSHEAVFFSPRAKVIYEQLAAVCKKKNGETPKAEPKL